jgi:prepilin peptidase CpaA
MLDWQTLLFLQKTISYAAMILLVVAAYGDIKTFRIPNALVLSIGTLGIIRLVLWHDPLTAIFAVAMVGLIFLAGILLFSFHLVGGGDVKLLMATSLMIRYPDYYEFFVLMALFGALLALMIVLLRVVAQSPIPLFLGPRVASSLATIRPVLPYGVAIAGAGIVTLLLQPMLFRYSVFFTSSFLSLW